jgi:hypothetical protein
MGGTAFAQDISVSAEASVSYGNWGTADGTTATFDFGTDLTFGLEATAGDYTYGATLTIEDGDSVDLGVIWVSGSFGKVSFGTDEFGELSENKTVAVKYDKVSGDLKSSDYGDVKYEGDFGAFGVTLVSDAEVGTTPGTGVAAGSATWWAEFTYAGDDFALGMETDSTTWAEFTYSGDGFSIGLETDSSSSEISGSFDLGTFTVGGSADDGSGWDVFVSTSMSGINLKITGDDGSVHGLEVDGTAGDISWDVATNTDSDTSASVTYASGGLSIGFAYDNDDAGKATGAVDTAGLVAGGLGVDDRGDEADVILTLGWATDALSVEVQVNGVGESEVSMTAGFAF